MKYEDSRISNSVRVCTINELVERVVVDAPEMSWYVRLRHLVEVVTTQQLVLARAAVVQLGWLRSLVPQPVTSFSVHYCRKSLTLFSPVGISVPTTL